MNATYDINELAAMKSKFTTWAHDNCGCRDLDDDIWEGDEYVHPDGHYCMCYGHDHYDDVDLAVIDDAGIVIHYGDRTLTMLFGDQGETFITSGTLEWVGDDCDYYGDVISFLADINNLEV